MAVAMAIGTERTPEETQGEDLPDDLYGALLPVMGCCFVYGVFNVQRGRRPVQSSA